MSAKWVRATVWALGAISLMNAAAEAGHFVPKSAAPQAPDTSSPSNEVLIRLQPGTDVSAFIQRWGLKLDQSPSFAPGYAVLKADTAAKAASFVSAADTDRRVLLVSQLTAHQQYTRDLPDDTLFANQWHLRNTGQGSGVAGNDINVTSWWNFAGNTHLGAGVNIAVVDDGLEYTHPDLAANYKAALSYDFNFSDTDPYPGASDYHGTSVAGVAAGRGNNGAGVSGVAPRAGLAGIRLISAATTDSQEAQALTFQNNNQSGSGTNHIYSNSWGPSDDGVTLEAPGTLTRAAFANAVQTGRGGKGSVFVWAGGNGYDADNSNYDGYANSRFVIAVGASTDAGVRSSYSERGANLFVNAPSSGGSQGITTTDRTGAVGYNTSSSGSGGDYTNSFGGTSSATPVVSGAVALMLEANPNLGWRDIKHILVRTSTKNDPTDSGWTTNAAGRSHNDKYGFGRINVAAATAMAQTWTNVGPEISTSASSGSLGIAIPDGSGASSASFGAPVSNTLSISKQLSVETVEVTVNVTHTWRGDLEFTLTAPTGTKSILGTVRSDSNDDYNNWTFTTVRDWDEMSLGNWTLSMRDGFKSDVGTFNSWSLNVYGTAVPEPSTMCLGMGVLAIGLLRRRRRPLAA